MTMSTSCMGSKKALLPRTRWPLGLGWVQELRASSRSRGRAGAGA
jgi:hypothetical protein